jgi:HK97 family phage prohead protease
MPSKNPLEFLKLLSNLIIRKDDDTEPQKIFRTFQSEIKEIDVEKRELTAIASTEKRDSAGDVILQNGWDFSRFQKNPVIPFAHNYSEPPIGKATKIWKEGNKETGRKTVFRMKFADHEKAETVFQLYAGGFMRAFSVGFIPNEWDDKEEKIKEGTEEKTQWTRYYKSQILLEISGVPVPANDEAVTLALKAGIIKKDSAKKFFNFGNKDFLFDKKNHEDEEKSIIPQKKQQILFDEYHETIKEYRRIFEKIRQLFGVDPEKDEIKSILKTFEALNDALASEEDIDTLGNKGQKPQSDSANQKQNSKQARTASKEKLLEIATEAAEAGVS